MGAVKQSETAEAVGGDPLCPSHVCGDTHRTDGDALEGSQIGEGERRLKGSADTCPRPALRTLGSYLGAVKADAARAGGMKTAEHVDEGCLSGSVGSDQSEDAAARELQVDVA